MRDRKPRRGFSLTELLIVIAVIAVIAAILLPVFALAREKARQATCLSNLRQIGQAFHLYCQDYDGTHLISMQLGSQARTWHARLEPYVRGNGIYTCPSSAAAPDHYSIPARLEDGRLVRYGYSYKPNAAVIEPYLLPNWPTPPLREGEIKRPAETILFADSPVGSTEVNWTEIARGGPGGVMYMRVYHEVEPDGRLVFDTIVELPIPYFTVHLGRVNFLFVDGHVKALKVADTFGRPPDPAKEMWGMDSTYPGALAWQSAEAINDRLARMHPDQQ
jgi:prepilin-type N-terminal cleavage/methylation domain-containing protein/prepilin-type processing-associated H-X9-DG protein